MFSLIRSLALFATVSVAPFVYADNPLPNPGFELGQDGWASFVPPAHAGAKVQWIIANEDPHSGAACAVMKSDEPVRWALSSKRSVQVLPGEKYRIQGWVEFAKDVKIEQGNPGAYIRVTLLEALGKSATDPLGNIHVGLAGVARNPSVSKLFVPQLPSGWQKIDAVVEIPANISSVAIALFSHGITGAISWDDVSFELVDPKTPLSKVLE